VAAPARLARRSSAWLIASAGGHVPVEIAGLSRDDLQRLNRWAPKRAELDSTCVDARAPARRLRRDGEGESLPAAYRQLYFDLQLATAWRETCWRQYVRIRGAIHPIRSRAGALGVMQVNARAWRGFYDSKGLAGDVAYNGRAGSEILLHYLVDLALARGEQRREGGASNLVRAAYGAYNGGPSQLTRYRDPKSGKRARSVDASLFEKHEAVRTGRELEVARCYG
jgi:hypothetical protein